MSSVISTRFSLSVNAITDWSVEPGVSTIVLTSNPCSRSARTTAKSQLSSARNGRPRGSAACEVLDRRLVRDHIRRVGNSRTDVFMR